MPSPAPLPVSPRAAPAHARAAAVLLLTAVVLAVCAPRAGAGTEDETGPAATDFRTLVTAWTSKDAHAVAQRVPEHTGRVRLSLYGAEKTRLSGDYTREAAQSALEEYFVTIDRPSLKDVTPATAGKTFTRTYDYTYRPKGGEERTTRLRITLDKGARNTYVLASITERSIPK